MKQVHAQELKSKGPVKKVSVLKFLSCQKEKFGTKLITNWTNYFFLSYMIFIPFFYRIVFNFLSASLPILGNNHKSSKDVNIDYRVEKAIYLNHRNL